MYLKRIQVAEHLLQSGLLPIFYHQDTSVAKEIIKACYAGGLRIIEFTNRAAFAYEQFAQIRKFVTHEFPDMFLGAGTIVDAPTAVQYIQMGADFIVSPILNEEMAMVCNRRKVLWVPGCGTLSEMSKAEELGAEIVKAFPANTMGGADFIKAIKGPCPYTNILVTGGVKPTMDNMAQWLQAGAACLGMGSGLITNDILALNDYTTLTLNVQQTLNDIQKIKAQLTSSKH